jgi:hypothetical protein
MEKVDNPNMRVEVRVTIESQASELELAVLEMELWPELILQWLNTLSGNN